MYTPPYLLAMALLFLTRRGQAFIPLGSSPRLHHLRSLPALRPLGTCSRPTTTTTRHAKGKGAKQAEDPNDPSVRYRNTVSLPQTGFDQRANAPVREPQIQQFWEESGTYKKLFEEGKGPKFILHDGPPYANGELHIGHALNKILKDFVNRYKTLRGYRVSYVPGWDCHGLPIELKVLQGLKSGEREGLTPITLREKASSFAKETVDRQRKSFKRFGVWGDWEEPYMTLQPGYEAAQIRVFGEMLLKGHIYRGRKPVHWSPSSRTALAEAELEYPENHISKSIYVGFPVTSLGEAPGAAALQPHHQGSDIRVAIWTTTPWTIPANLAVAINDALSYSLVTHPKFQGAKYIVATDLVSSLGSKVFKLGEGEKLEVLATMKGADLVGLKYRHPLFDREGMVVVGGDYITTESGTGLVHTAPGHGQEDYLTGKKYGLDLLSPVDDAGRFTEEAGPRFQGMDVLGAGNGEVINALNETGTLIMMEPYNHKYPYDWRTKKPTIFRATDQWFASVDSFRGDALKAIDEVQWVPDVGKRRISTMTESRSDWCISRQRSWGVPIPVFYRKSDGTPLMNEKTIRHVEKVFAEHGSDAWWSWSIEDLLPEEHKAEASKLDKGMDTMDVWFDSGSSWAGVVQSRESLNFPADLYLEGSDQHRGWFQSSLLTSVAATGGPPYKMVVTHGFVLDEKGYKMSKSLGNVVDPLVVINGGKNQKTEPPYGADVLRLWVSSVDYSGDVSVGPNILRQISDAYRKLRNTARYLIGNLHDFDPTKHEVPYEQLPRLDKYILGRLAALMVEVEEAYDTFQFYKASQALQRFAISDLSNFYLDIAKDRLYIAAVDDVRRRSCQTVLRIALEALSAAMAPILPHMAEDIWQNIPYQKPSQSVFQTGWTDARKYPAFEAEEWGEVLKLRDDVNKCMEAARQEGLIGASLEAAVYIHVPDDQAKLKAILAGLQGDKDIIHPPQKTNNVDDLRFLLLSSQVHVVSKDELVAQCAASHSLLTGSESGAVVGIKKASGTKCVRCWYWSETVDTVPELPHICPRCADAVKQRGGI